MIQHPKIIIMIKILNKEKHTLFMMNGNEKKGKETYYPIEPST
jgi:hypothetical protein